MRTNGKPPIPFGVILTGYRVARGLTQRKLADRAGFDHSFVSRLEHGSRVPNRDVVAKLVDALSLGDQERSRFQAAAGLLPEEPGALLADPALARLHVLLAANTLSPAVEGEVRATLARLADYAEAWGEGRA